jgi:hypothetical protein
VFLRVFASSLYLLQRSKTLSKIHGALLGKDISWASPHLFARFQTQNSWEIAADEFV